MRPDGGQRVHNGSARRRKRAVIKGTFATSAAQRARGRYNLHPDDMDIHASSPVRRMPAHADERVLSVLVLRRLEDYAAANEAIT